MIYDKMDECFARLSDNVRFSFDHSDLNDLYHKLDQIEGPCLITGVGGSSVVASFLAKVLREKKHIIATTASPRDIRYMDTSAYKDVICVSYSGNNIGVDVSFTKDLNRHLFTGHPRAGIDNLVYVMPQEISYVSIAATIVPLYLLASWYGVSKEMLLTVLDTETDLTSANNTFEVMSGYETQTAAVLLESSFTESGIGSCIIHDKYNYCHGRINITRNTKSDLIFFRMDNELDDTLIEVLKKHYENIIFIGRFHEDDVINDLHAAIVSLKLIRNIASDKGIDISDMKELPENDILYRFNGNM